MKRKDLKVNMANENECQIDSEFSVAKARGILNQQWHLKLAMMAHVLGAAPGGSNTRCPIIVNYY